MKKIIENLKQHSFEIGPIRPPSEGGSFSLLLRFTCNCPWNMCRFCYGTPYKRKKFIYRRPEEIKKDIDSIKIIVESLKKLSWKLGLGGGLDEYVIRFVLSELNYSDQAEKIYLVYKWLNSGGSSGFIQDADNMIIKTDDLIESLMYLKNSFPSIKRITTYARTKSVYNKSSEELKEIYEAGLSRLHIGLESGDDEILKEVKKGVTSKEHELACKKAKEAGYEVSLYIIPGLGGKDKSIQHAKNTAKVINNIDPHFVRSRPFIPRIGTPMYKDWIEGKFKILTPYQLLKELEIFVSELNFNGRLCFDHMRNPSYYVEGAGYIPLLSQSYDGYKFPSEKEKVLKIIKKGFNIKEDRYLKVEELIEYEKHIYGL